MIQTNRSDADGRFRFEQVPAGTVIVRAGDTGVAVVERVVEVGAGETARCEIDLVAPRFERAARVVCVVLEEAERRRIEEPAIRWRLPDAPGWQRVAAGTVTDFDPSALP